MSGLRLPRRMRAALAAAAFLFAAFGASPAHALCVAVCACGVTTSNVVFGSINPLQATNTDATGSILVSCGGVAGLLIPVTVDISKGSGPSYSARAMSSGANKLQYNLYADSAHTQVFGDATGSTVDGTGNIGLNALGLGPTLTFYVYGRVPGPQPAVVPADYSDAITVTMTYY
jgi:spore coat protein U-like protein